MNMALTQEWMDRARYCPGRNHVIDQCIMYNNHAKKKTNSVGKVVFWDTRGFEDIHSSEQATLILRYVLEGRIPPKCIPCVLLMSKELIKKRYQKVLTPERRIDLILNVSAIDEEPQTRLMKLVQDATTTSKIRSVKGKQLVHFVCFLRTLISVLTSEPQIYIHVIYNSCTVLRK